MVAKLDDTRGALNNCEDGQCEIPLSFSGIWGYGCWCNFGYDLTQGSGKPIDGFDGVCKSLQMCLRCARIDANEAGQESCDPVGVEYNATFSWLPSQEGIMADCSEQNPGSVCAAHVCTCELNIISDILDLLWSQVTFDSGNLHDNGFDVQASCTGGLATGNGKLKSCCGYYPTRTP